jgi:hypothetical protein
MPDREEITLLLDNTSNTPVATSNGEKPDSERREALLNYRRQAVFRMEKQKDKERKAKREAEREVWLREQSGITAVEAELLLPPKRTRRSVDSELDWLTSDDEEVSEDEEEEEDLGQSVSSPPGGSRLQLSKS